jgi:hypothetical protein
MVVNIQAVQIIFKEEFYNVRKGRLRIIPVRDFQYSLFILRNMNKYILLFTEKSKYRVGAERKKKH